MKYFYEPLKFSASRIALVGLLMLSFFNCSRDSLSEEEAVLTTVRAISLSPTNAFTVQAEAYDRMSGVRTETTSDNGGGENVGWIDTGDYLEYDVNVPAAGSYKFEFRVASSNNPTAFDFYQGNTKLASVAKPATNGWQNWITTTKTRELSAGNGTLKILATGGGWNINWIRITPVSLDNSNNTATNLALNKTAEQSSEDYGGGAERAVDGNTSGVWGNNSVTHTKNSNRPWWQVRLGQDYNIGQIKIWNRTDCCTGRLSDFDVFVYNNAGTQVFKTTIKDAPNPSVTVNTGGVSGSRIRIKLKGTDALSLAEVQVFGDAAEPTGTANIPADLMENCKQWKITYPTGDEDKTLCDENNNEFFYVNESRNGIVFRVPIRDNNGFTLNSPNVRSELRERKLDGSSDVFWTTDNTHVLYVKQAITHLPIRKDELVATQIHGKKSEGIDDAMVVRLEGSKMFLSFNGGKLRSNVTIKNNYQLGTVHEVIFVVNNGKHYCYYGEDGNLKSAYANGNAAQYLVKDGSRDYVFDRSYGDAYFKVGNYTQSNPSTEGSATNDPDNYGEVVVYDFYAEHSPKL
ncbi:carbohydrate-binding protein [Maribacter sp. 2-571]|uniref:carbohydrate-binding protein n=1 Tax=Maribacter sp. 2-571 TaxID=3417569 RepID=UPI003D33DF53